jgi:hypothetical protein
MRHAPTAASRVLKWSPVALGVLCMVLFSCIRPGPMLHGQNDFTSFFIGARLAGTPALYDRAANLAAMQAIHGGLVNHATWIRPAFYALLLKPLTAFPYLTAYYIFMFATLSSILWFVIRFAKECPPLPVFAAYSVPVLVVFHTAQDSPFVLALLGASLLLTRAKKDFLAGLVLSLCAIKFNLFVFIPILLLLKRRWLILAGSTCGGAVLIAVSLLVATPDMIRQWIDVLHDPKIVTSVIPNLHGLVLSVRGGAWLEGGLVGIVGVMFLWLVREIDDYEVLVAVAILGSLLVSFHSGLYDDVLLFPVFLLLFKYESAILRGLAAWTLVPIPYIIALADERFVGVLPLSFMALLGAILLAASSSYFGALILKRRAPEPLYVMTGCTGAGWWIMYAKDSGRGVELFRPAKASRKFSTKLGTYEKLSNAIA